ncbi:MAG: hypothetical protein WA949_23765 [Phormidesmis sp.]
MLAYTTLTDILQLPTALKALVYAGGLVFILVCPYFVLNLVDKVNAPTKPSQDDASSGQSDRQKSEL